MQGTWITGLLSKSTPFPVYPVSISLWMDRVKQRLEEVCRDLIQFGKWLGCVVLLTLSTPEAVGAGGDNHAESYGLGRDSSVL